MAEVLFDPFIEPGEPVPLNFTHSVRGDGHIYVAAFGLELPGLAGDPSVRVSFFTSNGELDEVDFSIGEDDDPFTILNDPNRATEFVRRAASSLDDADMDARIENDFAEIVKGFNGVFGPLDAFLSLQDQLSLRRNTIPIYDPPSRQGPNWAGQSNTDGQ